MMVGYEDFEIVRAWIMVRTDGDAHGVAEEIYGLNEKLTWPSQHIVRADVVERLEGFDNDFQIMVPVWADSQDSLEEICKRILEAGRAEVVRVALVQGGVAGHYPAIPHKAWGWATAAEANPVARPLGFNGWG
jgi:hypothetical protein